MNYNLNRLNPTDFEHMVQAFAQKQLGVNSIVFGAGPDGGRELTYEGEANFPNELNRWSGYWVIQAKYKTKEDTDDDFSWIKAQFKAEMKKFIERSLTPPDNYIFYTNAVLTPKLESGGRDRIEVLKEEYNHLIPNIFIGGYDEICRMLDNNRDVATSYASFVLSGDIMFEILNHYKPEKNFINDNIQTLHLYLENELKSEQNSKLIQAGSLAHTVNLENVFTDLVVTRIENSRSNSSKIYAVNRIIERGNQMQRDKEKKDRMVFVGGAGAGKSTITQFVCQLYTAYFLKYTANKTNLLIESIIDESRSLINNLPVCYRLPIKIVLKDYAGWITNHGSKESTILLRYIQYKVYLETGVEVDVETFRLLLKKMSFIFIFDGLDEVPANSNRNTVINAINNFVEIELSNANCDAIVLATTRPQGYSKEFDKDKYTHLYMSDMTDEICLKYLNKLLKNIEYSSENRRNYLTTLTEALKNEVTGNLMRTPLQATIMAILVVSGGEASSNKYRLFKDYYETIFKREKQKKVSVLINDYENQLNKVHDRLGYRLQSDSENKENVAAYMPKSEFEDLITDCLLEEGWIKEDIEKFVEEFRNIATQRLVFITEVQDDKVGFVIRSMQEFFAANDHMNTNDLNAIARIKNICFNSYWRNTLLFCIGNLRSKKEYLIDTVLVICQEMNGHATNPSDNDYDKLVYLGSWLSLDILTEGIIDDHPGFTNKFSRLLEPLLGMPYLPEHHKLNKLQIRVKESWILKSFLSLSDTRKMSKVQLKTYYYIIEMLLKTKNDNINSEALKLLIRNVSDLTIDISTYTLLESGQSKDIICNLLKRGLLELPTLSMEDNFTYIIDSEDNFHIIEEFYKKYADDHLVMQKYAEQMLYIILQEEYSLECDQPNLLKIFNLTLSKDLIVDIDHEANDFSILFYTLKRVRVKILSHLFASYNTLNRINRNVLEVLAKISNKYELRTLESYFAYCLHPSKENINALLLSIDTVNDGVLKKIFFSATDWKFNYLVREKFKLQDNLRAYEYMRDTLEIEGSYGQWLNDEFDLLHKKNIYDTILYANYMEIDGHTGVVGDSEIEYFNHLIMQVDDYNREAFLCLSNIIMAVSRTYKDDFDAFLYSINSVNDEAFEKFINMLVRFTDGNNEDKYIDTWSVTWYLIFASSRIDYIFGVIKSSNCFNNIFIFRNGLFVGPYVDHRIEICSTNMINMLNAFLNLKIDNSIVRYVTMSFLSIITYTPNSVTIEPFTSIDFKALDKMNFNSLEDRMCKLYLLLLSPEKPKSLTDSIIDFSEFLKNRLFLYYMLSCIENARITSSWVRDFIVQLQDYDFFQIILENSSVASAYYSKIKSIREEQPIRIV